MTLWLVLERELAESRGIFLPYLDQVAPDVSARWREDNKPAVFAMHAATITKKG